MSNKSYISAVVTAIILFKTPAAYAHAFVGEDVSWLAGLLHPLTGIDHVLALLAVGLWGTQQGGSKQWQLPLAFSSVMMLGAIIAQHGLLPLPSVEIGVGGSVLLLGLMLTFAARLSTFTTLLIVSFFALFHGYAHVGEIPGNMALASYLSGLLLTSLVLLCTGVMLGLWVRAVRYEELLRIGGLALGIAGGWLCM